MNPARFSLAAITIAVALTVGGMGPVRAEADLTTRNFQTPSENIVCNIEDNFLRCDIRSGLEPKPDKRCPNDWVGLFLPRARRAQPNCAGDTVANQDPPVLEYGETWERGAWHCTAKRSGLYCRNRGGWHFKLSRDDWDRWYTP